MNAILQDRDEPAAPAGLEEVQDELDELLGQGGGQAPVDDLDALLRESVQARDEALTIANMRKRLQRGALSAKEKEEIAATVAAWEARNVWSTVANVAVFEEVVCTCGFYTRVFSHLMHKQQHKTSPGITRLIRTEQIVEGLPRLTAQQQSTVEMCWECADKRYGFDPEKEDLQWRG
jgi:hypothetical protein